MSGKQHEGMLKSLNPFPQNVVFFENRVFIKQSSENEVVTVSPNPIQPVSSFKKVNLDPETDTLRRERM